MDQKAQRHGHHIDPDHGFRRGAQERHGNVDEEDARKAGRMDARGIDHAEFLRRMMIAVQRPEQFRMAQAMRPIVEEGIDIEIDHHLHRQGQACGIDGQPGPGRQPALQCHAGHHRQAQHHDAPHQSHDMQLIQDEDGEIRAHRHGRLQQGAGGAFLPAHHQRFQPQRRRQDQQHQGGVAQHLVMDIVEMNGVTGQRERQGIRHQVGQGPPARRQQRAIRQKAQHHNGAGKCLATGQDEFGGVTIQGNGHGTSFRLSHSQRMPPIPAN